MKALRRPNSLIQFACAELSSAEASAFAGASVSADIIQQGLDGFLLPDAFVDRYPEQCPEKYLVQFNCKGLMRADDGTVLTTDLHQFEVVFGVDYPSRAPHFVWLTPIWHPNIMPPYICNRGLPFAAGTALDQICLMAGHMIQYKNFNILDPLNDIAARWADQHLDMFPVDQRDLLDGTIHQGALVTVVENHAVEFLAGESDPVIEIVVCDGDTERSQ